MCVWWWQNIYRGPTSGFGRMFGGTPVKNDELLMRLLDERSKPMESRECAGQRAQALGALERGGHASPCHRRLAGTRPRRTSVLPLPLPLHG